MHWSITQSPDAGSCGAGDSSILSDPFGRAFYLPPRNITALGNVCSPGDKNPGETSDAQCRTAEGCIGVAGDIRSSPCFLQKDVLAAAWDVFGPRFPEFERLASIFTNTGIVKRHGVKPFEWYLEQRGWPERTEAFLEGAEALFVDVAGKALASARTRRPAISTPSSRSAPPASPRRAWRRASPRKMVFRSDISRVPVFGLGCAGGVSGLSIAARLAQARPGTNVLLVALELCSLALRLDELTKANIVAVACSATARLRRAARGRRRRERRSSSSGEHLWPDTLGIMGWSVDPKGFGVIFHRTIPEFRHRKSRIPPWCRSWRGCG